MGLKLSPTFKATFHSWFSFFSTHKQRVSGYTFVPKHDRLKSNRFLPTEASFPNFTTMDPFHVATKQVLQSIEDLKHDADANTRAYGVDDLCDKLEAVKAALTDLDKARDDGTLEALTRQKKDVFLVVENCNRECREFRDEARKRDWDCFGLIDGLCEHLQHYVLIVNAAVSTAALYVAILRPCATSD
jgi:hypothetical protein